MKFFVWNESSLPKCMGCKVTLDTINGGCELEGASSEMKSVQQNWKVW
jgi:hypothetical protein